LTPRQAGPANIEGPRNSPKAYLLSAIATLGDVGLLRASQQASDGRVPRHEPDRRFWRFPGKTVKPISGD